MVSRKKFSYAIVTLSGICVVTMQIYDLIFKFQLSLQIFFVLPHRFFNFFLEFPRVFLLEGGVGYPFKGVGLHGWRGSKNQSFERPFLCETRSL